MLDMEIAFAEFVKNSIFDKENYTLKEDEEYGEDGEVYCKKCKGARTATSPDGSYTVYALCNCKSQELEMLKQQEHKERMLENHRKIVSQLRNNSLIGKKYENVSFQNTDTDRPEDFKNAFARCKKFCENFSEISKNGLGIYLYGDYGTGKTQLACCIANYLLNRRVPVLFTSLYDIDKRLKNSYETGSPIKPKTLLEQLSNIELLIIDDLGTEIMSKNGQPNDLQVFIGEVINSRCNGKKSTIFTSNFSISELVSKKGYSQRLAERIAEMSTVRLKLAGKSYREKLCNGTDLF